MTGATKVSRRTLGPLPYLPFRPRPASFVAIGAVVAILAGLVVAKASEGFGGPSRARSATQNAAADQRAVLGVTTVPPAVLQAAGRGPASNPFVRLPASAPALQERGLPVVLYVGAEYCPYCAAQRWAAIVALSRFGTFSGLSTSQSAADDVFPRTPTFTFHGSTFASSYLVFDAVETATNVRGDNGRYAPLDSLTPEQARVVQQFDNPPYVSNSGAIPFLDLANRYVLSGASFDPTLLHGMTLEEIVAALRDPASELGRAIDGSANALTAAICRITADQPAAVCGSPTVRQAGATLEP